MKRVFNWLKSWWGFSQVFQQIYYMQDKIENLQKLKSKSDKEIEKHQEQLDVLQIRFNEKVEETRSALNEASSINKKYKTELEAIHEELTTKIKIVIPGLIAANKTFTDAWDAQSSQYAAAQAMSGQSKDI